MDALNNTEMQRRTQESRQYVDEIWKQLETQMELPDISHPYERRRWLAKNGIGIHQHRKGSE